MGKIGVSATKYIIKAKIETTGVVEKPDVIGAIFGQTEGLLGKELELRELQKGGRIGRIEVKVASAAGKGTGTIEIPTSLSKEDTALIAAALETIERIGPCDSKIAIQSIEDVRTAKRDYVVDRAKSLLASLGLETPGSSELSDQVRVNVRTGELKDYGPVKLAGGPDLEKDKDIILVEGRADVLNLLRHNITNILSVGGTNIHPSIKDLCAGKEVTVFLDGDRGGDLILKSLMQFVKVEYVARAPTGLEVEELTQKDALKALRNKVTIESAMRQRRVMPLAPRYEQRTPAPRRISDRHTSAPRSREPPRERYHTVPRDLLDSKVEFKPAYKVLGKIASGMAGTGNACILKKSGASFREVGKVPISELPSVIKNLQQGAAQALIIDAQIDQSTINLASMKGIKFLLGHTKPYKLKRTPGLNVLDVRDIVLKPSILQKSTAMPVPTKVISKPTEIKKEVKK